MDRRYPSTSSAIPTRSSVRHRSGSYTPKVSSPSRTRSVSSAASSRHSNQTLTVQVEDADAADSAPRVLFVRPSKASVRARLARAHPPAQDVISTGNGPSTPPRSRIPSALKVQTAALQQYEDDHAPFSPVPLTPRPVRVPRAPSASSVQTTRTAGVRLPTPDFTTRSNSFRSFIPRLFSTRAAHRPSPLGRASSTRSAASSTSSCSTVVTSCSNGSIHPSRIPRRPPLGSTLSSRDKFTKKFPRPQNVRTGSSFAAEKQAFPASVMEEGEGLGIERVNRWTVYKWCLLVSVSTVFVYGMAGLICAMMTWFGSALRYFIHFHDR